MFKIRSRRGETEKPRGKKQLWGRDFDIVKNGLDEEQVVDFVNSLVTEQGSSGSVRTIIQKAIKGAEQIIDSIKMRARAEAEEEASRIIAQAREKAGAIMGGLETETGKEVAEEVPSEAVSKSVAKEAKALKEESEDSTQAREEELSETVVATVLEEKPAQKEATAGRLGQDKQSIYSGHVDIVMLAPINTNMVTKLYNYIHTTPEIKLISTSGSWNKGTTLTVNVDKPIPLMSVLESLLPDSEIRPALPDKEATAKIMKGVKVITIAQKGCQPLTR